MFKKFTKKIIALFLVAICVLQNMFTAFAADVNNYQYIVFRTFAFNVASDVQEENIEIGIYKDDTLYKTLTLTKANNYSEKLQNLVDFDNQLKDSWNMKILNSDKFIAGFSEELSHVDSNNNVLSGPYPTYSDDNIVLPKSSGLYALNTRTYNISYKTSSNYDMVVRVVWDETGNPDSVEHEPLPISLYDGDTLVQSGNVSASNNWELTWRVGTPNNQYVLAAPTVDGYNRNFTSEPDNATQQVINTFTYTYNSSPSSVRETDISFDTEWIINTITKEKSTNINFPMTVDLMDGERIVQTINFPINNSYKHTIENVPLYDSNNRKIDYTIEVRDSDKFINIKKSRKQTTSGDKIEFLIENSTHYDLTTKIVWDDEGNEADRPDSTSITFDNGTLSNVFTLTSQNGYTQTIRNIPVEAYPHQDNQLPDAVSFNEPAKYFAHKFAYIRGASEFEKIWKFTYQHQTNTFLNEKIKADMVWDDAQDRDGLRHDVNIDLYITRDGVATLYSTYVFSKDKETDSHTFDDVVLQNGDVIAVNVRNLPDKYGSRITPIGQNHFSVVLTHSSQDTNFTISKVWDDNNNASGNRPDSIEIQLTKNGSPYGDPVELNEQNSWQYTWENLRVMENGVQNAYSINEPNISRIYSASYEGSSLTGGVLTNKLGKTTATVMVDVEWIDDDNADSLRPDKFPIEIYRNDVLIDTIDITGPDWSFSKEYESIINGQQTQIVVKPVAPIPYYTTTSSQDDATKKITFTNTREKNTVDYTVNLAFDDADNVEGLRPSNVDIVLLANGVEVKREQVSSVNQTKVFANLPKFANSSEIVYTVQEFEIPFYGRSITSTPYTSTIIFKHTPVSRSFTVNTVWSEIDSTSRPKQFTAVLYANDSMYDTVQLTSQNNYSHVWNNLPDYRNGRKMTYRIGLDNALAGYDTTIENNNDAGVFTHKQQTKSITVKKVWEQSIPGHAFYGDAPTIQLYRNNNAVGQEMTMEMNGNTVQPFVFQNLPVYVNGRLANYTVKETNNHSFNKSYYTNGNEITITNSPSIVSGEIKITKTWENDKESYRPDSITFKLYCNEKYVKDITLSAPTWTTTVENVLFELHGETLNYSLVEKEVENYTSYYTRGAESISPTPKTIPAGTQLIAGDKLITLGNSVTTSTMIYNLDVVNVLSNVPENSISIKVVDENDAFISGITYDVYESTTSGISLAPVFSFESKNFPYVTELLEAGKEYMFIYKNLPPAYKPADLKVKINKDTKEIVLQHPSNLIDVDIIANFSDYDNKYNTRPESITVDFYEHSEKIDSFDLNKTNNFRKTANVPLSAYAINVTPPTFTSSVQSNAYNAKMPNVEGYRIALASPDNLEVTYMLNLTNIQVETNFVGDSNFTHLRPDNFDLTFDFKNKKEVVNLTKNNSFNTNFEAPDLFIDEANLDSLVEDFDISNYIINKEIFKVNDKIVVDITLTFAPTITVNYKDSNGNFIPGAEFIVVDNNGNTVYSFTTTDKSVIIPEKTLNAGSYTIKPKGNVPSGYTNVEKEFDSGVETTVNLISDIEKKNITTKVVWDDEGDTDGFRPGSLKVGLYSNNTKVNEFTFNTTGNEEHTFNNLDVYTNSQLNNYSVKVLDSVPNYEVKTEQNNDTFTITLKHTVKTETVTVSKVWNDSNYPNRPEKITIQLLANGNVVDEVDLTNSKLTHTFTNLATFINGKQAVYSVKEKVVPAGYNSSIKQNNNLFTITNTREVEKVNLNVNVVWDDTNNNDNKRPASLDITLLANGKEAGKTTLSNNFTHTFNVPKFDGSYEEIIYSLKGITIPGYKVSVVKENDTITITATHDLEKINLVAKKVWNDNNYPNRPEKITVQLLADDNLLTETDFTGEKTEHTFENVNVYNNGKKISYEVKEKDVPSGYTSIVKRDGNTFTITNTREVEKIKLSVNILWNDNNNQDGLRPETLKVVLLANGKEVETATLSKDFKYTFNVPKYDNDYKEITYTLKEVSVPKYETTTTYNKFEFNVVAKHTPEKTNLTVKKVWDDNNDKDKIRPKGVSVDLLANEEVVDTIRLNDVNNWEHIFENLDVYKNGKKINYLVRENVPENYRAEITVKDNVYTIKNIHEAGKATINIEKKWDDDNNRDGIRPASIKVVVLADNVVVKEVELNKTNEWKMSITDLEMYKEGKKIEYSIREVKVDNYECSINRENNNFVITNKYAPKKIDYKVTKVWKSSDNKPVENPQAVKVELFANDKVIETFVLDKNNNFTHTFNLYKFEDGKEIKYSVREEFIKSDIRVEYKYDTNAATITNTIAAVKQVNKTQTPPRDTNRVQTGDENNMTLFILMMLALAIAVATVIKKYFMNNK